MADDRVPRIYVAADYRRQGEARALLEDAERAGFEVTCRWAIQGEPGDGMGGTVSPDQEGFAQAAAVMDLADIRESDVVVQLTTGQLARGGRQVELGAALAWGKTILVVGPKEHVFHHHGSVDHVETVAEALGWLKGFARA